MRLRNRLAGIVLACVVGCSGPIFSWEPDTYAVTEGDTVYSIAFRYGLDYRELARLNGLDARYLIHPGQVLALRAPNGSAVTSSSTAHRASGSPATPPISSIKTSTRDVEPAGSMPDWVWPTPGKIAAGFNAGTDGNRGINIGGEIGQSVKAAADGRVVYSGSGLIGYGPLIIVKHNNTYLSAYGHNRLLLVREGDQVKAGQNIAEMGDGPDKRPVLHFEIRRNGQPVDPIRYLPKR